MYEVAGDQYKRQFYSYFAQHIKALKKHSLIIMELMTATNDFSLKHLGSCAELRLTHGIKQLFILKTCSLLLMCECFTYLCRT